MKYIKIFEEFGEKLYEQMNINEIRDIIGYYNLSEYHLVPGFLKFTPVEIDRFNRIRYFGVTRYKKCLVFIPHHKVFDMVYLYSLGDEWYVIQEETQHSRKFYKCDTIEGVKQYLNDENLIENQ